MKPTAPPVKRGRSGHERRAELGHQPAQRRDERLVALGRHARTVDDRLAVARAQHQERILAEERIPRDALAAFDALEEEGVVGVLGDLQERRHRREQVGDDLLDDRHERAAPREIDEFFERGLFHRSRLLWPLRSSPAACRGRRPAYSPAGGRWPVHSSN